MPEPTLRVAVEDGEKCVESGAREDFALVEFAEPRELPWGRIASTSLSVPWSAAVPAEIATTVEGFLRGKTTVNVLKVNPKKLSIRAVAQYQQLGSCVLKVRLFQLPDEGSSVLEFTRRSGCALAFAEIFRQVAGFLSGRFDGVRAVHGEILPEVGDDVSLLVASPSAAPLAEEAYAPLMEIVAGSADPECKVDAIAALALAAAGCEAAAACLGQVLACGFLEVLLEDPAAHVAASAELVAAERTVHSLLRGQGP